MFAHAFVCVRYRNACHYLDTTRNSTCQQLHVRIPVAHMMFSFANAYTAPHGAPCSNTLAVEFLVDSGASATVIGEEAVRAVSPSAPDPNKNYRLADGSLIPTKGEKWFLALTPEGVAREMRAQVTDVDRPLMSVAQVVRNGGRVVFDERGSYTEGGGNNIAVSQEGGLFKFTMWVPGEQGHPVSKLTRSFHGQA